MRSRAKTAATIAASAASATLHVPRAELDALRALLSTQQTLTSQSLYAAFTHTNLNNAAFHDALFALCTLTDSVATVSTLLMAYRILRHLALNPLRNNAIAHALWLVFHAAARDLHAEALAWPAFERCIADVGIGVGGVDSMPDENVSVSLHKRWRRTSRLAFCRGRTKWGLLDFASFLKFSQRDLAGLIPALRAIGFLLTHAVLDLLDDTNKKNKPVWHSDAESPFLSQYVTHAISRLALISSEEDAMPSGTIDDPDEEREAQSNFHSVDTEKINNSGVLSNLLDNLGSSISASASRQDYANQSEMSILCPTSGECSSADISEDQKDLILVGSARVDEPPCTLGLRKSRTNSTVSGASSIRRTQHVSGTSPFHIDFSSLQFGEKIGSGAHGDVYKGRFLMSPVAIKQFNVNILPSIGNNVTRFESGEERDSSNDNQDPTQFNRQLSTSATHRFASENTQGKYRNFVREVEMMSVVRHPNLVLYMGACGDLNTPLCIVSELFEGGSLYEYLHGDAAFRPNLVIAISFAVNIARGMYYLHASDPSILHRDLKSRNVLLSGRKGRNGAPHVVICDFGLCQLFGESTACVSGGGQCPGSTNAMGTAAYMSPGVIRGEKYEAADDVYSYGVLLHEIFTGDVLYEGLRAMQVLFGVAEEGLRPRGAYDEAVPKSIRILIAECWHDAREKRPLFSEIITRLTDIESALSG